MALPKDILLTSAHDIDMSEGAQLTGDLLTYVTQKLRQRLRFFLGEWFLDRRLGVPYFESVFVSNPDLALLSSLFRQTILQTRGVGSINSLVLRFDRKARMLFVSFQARLVDSQEKVTFDNVPFVLRSPEREAS
jgi:hypothetical protein